MRRGRLDAAAQRYAHLVGGRPDGADERPYGIGAKFGHPDRPVIVFEGDGAMQMNGLAELITKVQEFLPHSSE